MFLLGKNVFKLLKLIKKADLFLFESTLWKMAKILFFFDLNITNDAARGLLLINDYRMAFVMFCDPIFRLNVIFEF